MANERSRAKRGLKPSRHHRRNSASGDAPHHPARNEIKEGVRHAVGASLLRLGAEALAETLAFRTPADTVLRQFFREHRQLGRRDRAIVAEGTYAALRRLCSYRVLSGDSSPRRLFLLGVQHHLRSSGSPVDMAVSEAERAWLAGIANDPAPDAPFEVRAELPDWIVAHLRRSMSDEDILMLAQGMQSAAPLDLRVNTLRSSRDDVIARLQASDLETQPTPYSPLGIRVQGKPALEQHEVYKTGAVEVQDEGSQLLGFLLAPRRREMVVDFCAGAGGKTLLLGAMMRSEGRLYAFDVSPQRLHRLRARVARAGLSNVQVEVVANENDVRFKRLAGKIDRVLVDAPCTGLGTLRRNPDLKWRQQPADLDDLQGKQRRILAAAAKLLKPGGRLVYATCSVLPDENDLVADDFLQSHPEFRALDCGALLADQGIALECSERLRLAPHRHGTDAFFAAAFERVRDSTKTTPTASA